MTIRLSRRAERDLRRLDLQLRARLVDGLRALEAESPNLDIKPLKGSPPWLRLRVGEHRILYRAAGDSWFVERIVDRRDLERAVRSLP